MKRTILLVVVLLLVGAVPAQAAVLPNLDGCRSGARSFVLTVSNPAEAHEGRFGYFTSQDDQIVDLGIFKPGEMHTYNIVLARGRTGIIIYAAIYDGATWQRGVRRLVLAQGYTPYCARTIQVQTTSQPPVIYPQPQIVMVTFISDTALYWHHAAWANTGVLIQAGKTAQALDVEGAYTRIVWADALLWVPSKNVISE